MNDGQVVQLGSPREIYEAPLTRFVADFIGSSNFMDCRVMVRGREAGRWMIDSPSGVLEVASEEERAVDDRLTVAIRPENIHLIEPENRNGAAGNLLEGRVDTKVFYVSSLDQLRVLDWMVMHDFLKFEEGKRVNLPLPRN